LITGSSSIVTDAQATYPSKLGDLSQFRTIVVDTKSLVDKSTFLEHGSKHRGMRRKPGSSRERPRIGTPLIKPSTARGSSSGQSAQWRCLRTGTDCSSQGHGPVSRSWTRWKHLRNDHLDIPRVHGTPKQLKPAWWNRPACHQMRRANQRTGLRGAGSRKRERAAARLSKRFPWKRIDVAYSGSPRQARPGPPIWPARNPPPIWPPPNPPQIYPEWRGYDFILVRGQYIILRPRTHEIVYLIED
jgi:hypothetical protein